MKSMEGTPLKITRSVTHRVNMGHYEHIETTAEITTEVFTWDDDMELVAAELDAVLHTLVAPTLAEALETTDEKDSYVHLWKADKETAE